MKSINVLMMGGRRAGKTSVLAAVDKCCTETLRGQDKLKIDIRQGTGSLHTKQTELEQYFKNPIYKKKNYFIADLNPSPVLEEYIYEAQIRNSKYRFTFTDIPGEAYASVNADNQEIKKIQEKLPDLIASNHVLIIAIDTPHMMEHPYNADGVCEYHRLFNRVDEITNFIKENFTADEDKLVIIVPLKCEKYYYNGKMNKIPELIRKGYSDLFDFFESEGPNKRFSVIIDPILTIGGAEFFKFEEDARATGYYNYVKDAALRQYLPKYCDNPMYLMILYLIRLAKMRNEKQNGFIKWFGETFLDKASYSDLVSVEDTIKGFINNNKPEGFEVVQNPFGMGV